MPQCAGCGTRISPNSVVERRYALKFASEATGGCGLWTGRPGNVDPDEPEALRLDGRRIGWGIYQTAFVAQTKEEADAWHPVIDVMRTVPGRAQLELELCFKLD